MEVYRFEYVTILYINTPVLCFVRLPYFTLSPYLTYESIMACHVGGREQKQSNQTLIGGADDSSGLVVDHSTPISHVDHTANPSALLTHSVTPDSNLSLLSTPILANPLGGPSNEANTCPDVPHASAVSHIGSSNQMATKVEPLTLPEVQTCTDTDPGSLQSTTEAVPFSVPQVPSEADTGNLGVEVRVQFYVLPLNYAHLSTFGYCQQDELRNQIIALKIMMDDLGDQYLPRGDRILIDRVVNETEAWMNGGRGAVMGYDAQLALLCASGKPVAKSKDWDFDSEASRSEPR